MAKSEAKQIVGQIEQEEKKLQEIEEKIDSFSAKARNFATWHIPCKQENQTLKIL
ncbi:hypothetical protein [Brevibacillus brevis]|uniref:hypothetical protein n=1 Tax=Brevibacillus brevis TaxID=1393 RepID=UPI0016437276|nr:hypothetical protein [Brevibacillus brevis]